MDLVPIIKIFFQLLGHKPRALHWQNKWFIIKIGKVSTQLQVTQDLVLSLYNTTKSVPDPLS